jgi:glycerophosphoryl diester phosphodiesterase
MPAPGEGRPLLLGHRGARARKEIPENTIASFDQALADGCDGFEFDVRLTADGVAVVCHDPQFAGIEIASSSVRELGRLPQLEKVLSRYRASAFLDIELKVSGLERIAVELMGAYSLERGFVLSSFLPEVLTAIHAEDASTPLGLICESEAELRAWTQLPVQFVIPHFSLVTGNLIGELKAAGKRILVWTVNDAADMRGLRDQAVDGIISDDTKLLHCTLGC